MGLKEVDLRNLSDEELVNLCASAETLTILEVELLHRFEAAVVNGLDPIEEWGSLPQWALDLTESAEETNIETEGTWRKDGSYTRV